MSGFWDKDKPRVMDEAMLQKAVEEQGPQDRAGRIAGQEGVEFSEVLHLCLEFRNILNIEHLWQFTSLTKLQLNNNLIRRMEGLDRLTNLTWLDLSFNDIERVEGLEPLSKLQVLNLLSNRISVVENMEALEELSFLSLANNLLDQLHHVIYLRRFKKLHTLNLSGNPVSREESYKLHVLAHLPDLVYLDYKLVTNDPAKEQASAKYQYALEEAGHDELQARRATESGRRREEELRTHQDAFVECLDGAQLCDRMSAEDPEAEKLGCLPGVEHPLETLRLQLAELCQQIFEVGLAERRRRAAEVGCFSEGLREGVAENGRRAALAVAEFERNRAERMKMELMQVPDSARFNRYRQEVQTLCDDLMTLELLLVDQLEDLIKEFERNITDMVASFTEAAQGKFAQCRDLENHHHEKMKEIATATLEKVAKNEVEGDMPEDVRALFLDGDRAMDAVAASHHARVLTIDNREDELVLRVKAWAGSLIEEVQDGEVKRNRKRILEIQNYIDHLRNQLD